MEECTSSIVLTTLIVIVLVVGIVLFLSGTITEDTELVVRGSVVLGISIVLAIKYVLAACFYSVANEKDYYEARYLWIPFLFSFVGYILVAALPDRGNRSEIIVRQSEKVKTDFLDNKINELDNLKNLLEAEMISKEEFEAKKKEILDL